MQSYYRCDNKFHLDEILEMYEEEDKFGIVLVSGETCRIYTVIKSGDHTQIKEEKNAQVHQLKGHKKGGQSAPRFQRLRDENEEAQIKKVAEHMVNAYWNHELSTVTVSSIMIGGPAEFKNKVREHPLIKQFFNSAIVGVVTTGSIDDKLVDKVYYDNKDLFVNVKDKESLKVISEIEKLIERGDDKLIFGFDEARENLAMCLLDKLVVNNTVPEEDKRSLVNLNQHGCKLHLVNPSCLQKIGVDIVGVKFY